MKIKLALLALAAGAFPPASEAAAAKVQTFTSETKIFREWKAVCDNINNCAAYGPAEGNTGYVMVKIDAGPEETPRVHAGSYALPSLGGRMDLTIDGRSFTAEDIQLGSETPVMTFQQPSDDLIRAIGNARSMSLSSGNEATAVAVSGAAAAFLWIDERQGRLGTTTALIRKGDRPASTVPAAPSAPKRVVAAPARLMHRPQTMPASVFGHEKLTECNARNREPVSANSGWGVYSLGTDTLLWAVPCGMGAYNTMELYLTSTNEGSNVQAISFHSSKGSRDILVNSEFDSATHTISAFNKSRGPGDCGQNASWAWNGNIFALVEENTMEDCFGMHSDLWPSLWRTQG